MRVRAPAPVAALAALAPAAALACDPGGFFPFGPAKWLAVTLLVPAGVALLLARRPARFAPAPTIAMAVLVGAMALAAAVGEDPLYAWIGTPERHLGVLAWALTGLAFLAGQSTEPGDRWPVVGGLVAAGAGVGAMAVAEALGRLPHVLDAGSRLGGPFGSPAYLGAAVALLLPVAIGVMVDRSTPRAWRAMATGAGVALVFAVLGSGARAAWVGLAIASVATAVAQRRRLTPGRRRLTAAAVLAAAVAAIGVVAVATPVGDRVTGTFDEDAAGGQGRLDEWRVAVAVLADHPLTGVGPEGYRVALPDGIDVAYEREHGRDPLPDRAHSAPLDVALAGGPLGLAAWLALLVLLAQPMRRALTGDRPWLIGVAAGLLAYASGELLLFPLAELEPAAALLAGVVVAATARPGELRTAIVPRIVPAALGAVAVVAVAAGVLDLAADRQADQAAQALSQFDPSAAVDHAERAVDLRPDILRHHLLLAAALEADQRGLVAAIAAVDDGLDVSPGDPIALRRRAELLVVRADRTLVPAHIDAARAELASMLADDPTHAELWVLTGVVARLDGDIDAARAAFWEAGRITPGDPRPFIALVQLELERLYVLAGDGTG